MSLLLSQVKIYDDEKSVVRHLNKLESLERKKFFLSHVYIFCGVVNEILDDGQMWNHSGLLFNKFLLYYLCFYHRLMNQF